MLILCIAASIAAFEVTYSDTSGYLKISNIMALKRPVDADKIMLYIISRLMFLYFPAPTF